MSQTSILFLALVAVTFAVTSAISPDAKLAIKAAAIPLFQECGKELGISEKDVLTAKENKDVDALNPCFYACFFKKSGLFNEDNLFDVAAAIEKSGKYVSGEDTETVTVIANKCASVNDQAVGDSDGCDRAKLLVDCFIKENHSLLSA